MTKAIDILVNDFESQLSKGDLIEIEWKTLNEKSVKVYTREIQSSVRLNKVLRARQEQGEMHFFVGMIINYAYDENGKHLFKPGHRDSLLKKVDMKEIMEVGGLIASVILVEDDEDMPKNFISERDVAEKNSQTMGNCTPGSPSHTD